MGGKIANAGSHHPSDPAADYVVKDWYNDNRGWHTVYRHPNTELAELASNLAIAGANNDKVQYSQGDNQGYWRELQANNYDPSAISKVCYTDCFASCCANVHAAARLLDLKEFDGMTMSGTGTAPKLKKVGFKTFTDTQHTRSCEYAERGDIYLCDGHATMFVGDGEYNGSGGAGGGSILNKINFEETSPYIIGIPETKKTFDAAKLKKNQVMGVLLSAGYLYSSGHLQMSDYVNKNLKSQVNSCKDANLPWALYATVRAHTVAEAQKECERLYYVVSAYPPRLSLWLKLEMNMTKATNERILDYYYEQMIKWGFKNTCGIYVNKKELKQIDWLKYQEKFYLWYADHTLNIDDWIDKVPDPANFEIEYDGKPKKEEDKDKSSSTSSVDGNEVVKRARAEMGKPYAWGATGPNSYDCSGLVGYCLTGNHTRIGTTGTFMGWPQTKNPVAGDVCTNKNHCGIYIGGGKMIHAPRSGDVVKEGNVHSDMIYVKYKK